MSTYYVASAGSNSNAGTSTGSPWLTIAHAISSSTAGDVINLNGGDTFTENPALTAGTGGRTIQSYGAGQATIAGGSSSAITVTNVDAITISNLIVTQTPGLTATTNFPNPGVIYLVETSGTRYSGGITITGCTITGGVGGIVFNSIAGNTGGWNGITISGNTVHDTTEVGILLLDSTNSSSFVMHYSNVQVLNNTVYNIPGDGNTAAATGFGILVICCDSTTGTGAAQCVIQGNLVYHTAYVSSVSPGGNQGGQIEINNSDSVIIKNNVAHDGYGETSFDIDYGCTNCIMEYNYSYNNKNKGFYAFSSGGGNTIRFNLSVMDQYGLVLFGTGSFNIHNNTCINWYGVGLWSPNAGATAAKKLYNNIFYAGTCVSITGTGGTGFDMRGNAYLSQNGTFLGSYNGSNYTTLAAWRTATGLETGQGFQGTVNFASTNFMPAITPTQFSQLIGWSLIGSSPLAGAGLDLNTLFSVNPGAQDLLGNQIPVPYSVGAINPPSSPTPWVSAVQVDTPWCWYRLDETSGTFLWNYALSNPLTYSGGFTLGQPSLLPADSDQSVAFNGTNGYADGTNTFPLIGTKTFIPFICPALTVECWVKITSLSTAQSFVGGKSDFILGQSGTEITWFTAGNVGFSAGSTSGAGLVAGHTYHVLATSSGNVLKVYLNGVLQTFGYTTGPANNATYTYNNITVAANTFSGTAAYLGGQVDEVVVYQTALSGARALAHYNAGIATFGDFGPFPGFPVAILTI